MTALLFPLDILLLVVAGVAALYDVRFRRIPNWLVVSGAMAGLVGNAVLLHLAGVRDSLLGLGLAFAVYLPFYLLHAMGAGDLKLMAAIGAIAGPCNWMVIFVLTAIAGGLVAIGVLATRGGFRRTFSNIGFILIELAHFRLPHTRHSDLDIGGAKAVTLPHGAAIAAGSIVFLLASR